jgi:hypothetical protein
MKFSDCGEAYRLRYLTGAPRQPQGALIAGIAVHDTIEHAYREGWHLDPYSHADDFVSFFALTFHDAMAEVEGDLPIRWGGRKSKAWPNGEDAAWWNQMAPQMLQRAADTMIADTKIGNQVWGTADDPVAGIELTLNVPVPDIAVPVTARIDALMVDPNGEPFVRDWTTGRPGGKTPVQGALYAWALANAEGFGLSVERCQYVFLKSDDPKKMIQDFDPRPMMDRVVTNFQMMNTALDAGVFLMRPSSFCAGCEVKASCDYGRTL